MPDDQGVPGMGGWSETIQLSTFRLRGQARTTTTTTTDYTEAATATGLLPDCTTEVQDDRSRRDDSTADRVVDFGQTY